MKAFPASVLLVISLVLAACTGELGNSGSSPPPAPASEPAVHRELTASRPLLDQALKAAESLTLRIPLPEGAAARVVVDQRGIDVDCTLIDPRGRTVLEVDNKAGAWGVEELVWVVEETGDHLLEIRASRVEAADGRFSAMVEHAPAVNDDRRRATAARLFDAGERWARQRDAESLERAESSYRDSLAIWQTLGDPGGQAEALYRLGRLHAARKQWSRTLELYAEAEKLFEQAGNVRMQSVALQQMGRAHFAAGSLEAAEERWEQALQLRLEIGDRRWQAFTLNNLGMVKGLLGEFQQALSLYDEALERWRQGGERSQEAMTLHNRGKCFLYLGQFQQALDDLNRALTIRQELDERLQQALTLIGIGVVYESLALYPESDEAGLRTGVDAHALGQARHTLQRSMEILQELGRRSEQADTLSVLARVHAAAGQGPAAENAFQQALSLSRELGERYLESIVLYDYGSFLLSLGDTRGALDRLGLALRLLEDLGGHSQVDVLYQIARAQRRRGDLEAARDFIETAIAKNEVLRFKPASHTLRSSFFALRQSFYGFYVDLLMELEGQNPSAGYAEEALAVSERARARSQLEALFESGVDLRRGTDPELMARELDLEKRIHAKEMQRLRLLDQEATAARRNQLEVAESELDTLLREHERVRGRRRLSSPRYLDLTQPKPLDARQIKRQLLDGRTRLLQYHLGFERSYVWVVEANEVTSFELPDRRRLEAAARRAYELLSISHRRESRLPTQEALAELSDLLLRPIAEKLAGERLLVVAEGTLHYVPFAALPLPVGVAPGSEAGPAPTLASRFEIVHGPSASTLAELRRRAAQRPAAPGTLAVVADPVFQPHDPRFQTTSPDRLAAADSRGSAADLRRFERLVYSEQEAAAILSLLPDSARSFEATGFDANRETVLGGALEPFRMIHFATHGYLDAERPELSRLVLSLVDREAQPRDGLVFAHEIYNLELPAELVVLSACRTALGKEVRGEGLIGLTQAFMYAGATSVLVSLWPVNDEATAELMARFYRHLIVEELAPAAALRQAQLAIGKVKRWQAPYYWAGFVLQGSG